MFLIPNPKWKNRTELNKPFKKYLKLMIIGRHFPANVLQPVRSVKVTLREIAYFVLFWFVSVHRSLCEALRGEYRHPEKDHQEEDQGLSPRPWAVL